MARFDPDNPSELRPLKWYFTPPGTPFFMGPNAFSSLLYVDAQADDGSLGEVFGQAREYSKGETPVPYPSLGGCAPDGDFEDGISLGGDWPLNSSGVKQCCYGLGPCVTNPPAPSTVPLVLVGGGSYDLVAEDSATWSCPIEIPLGAYYWDAYVTCMGSPATMQLVMEAYSGDTPVYSYNVPQVGYDPETQVYTFMGSEPYMPDGTTFTIDFG